MNRPPPPRCRLVSIRLVVDVARVVWICCPSKGGRHPSTVIATILSVIVYSTFFVVKGSKYGLKHSAAKNQYFLPISCWIMKLCLLFFSASLSCLCGKPVALSHESKMSTIASKSYFPRNCNARSIVAFLWTCSAIAFNWFSLHASTSAISIAFDTGITSAFERFEL